MPGAAIPAANPNASNPKIFILDSPLMPIATVNKLVPSISPNGTSPSASAFMPGAAINAAIPNAINPSLPVLVKASIPSARLARFSPFNASNKVSPSANDFIPGPATNAAKPKRNKPGAPNNNPIDAIPAAAPNAISPPAILSISVKPIPAKACMPSPISLSPYPTPIIPGVAINAATPNANNPADATNINGNAIAKATDITAMPVPTPTNPANPTPDKVVIASLIILNARLIPKSPGVAINAANPIAINPDDPAIKNGLAKLNAIPNNVNDPATASKLPALISNNDLSPHASKAIGTAAIAAATPNAANGMAAIKSAGETANIDNANAPNPNAIPAICAPLISLNPFRPKANNAKPGPAIIDAAPIANSPKDPAIKNGVATANPIPRATRLAVIPNISKPLMPFNASNPLANISNPVPIACIAPPSIHSAALNNPIPAAANANGTNKASSTGVIIISIPVNPNRAMPALANDSHSTLLNSTNALLKTHNAAAMPAIPNTPFNTCVVPNAFMPSAMPFSMLVTALPAPFAKSATPLPNTDNALDAPPAAPPALAAGAFINLPLASLNLPPPAAFSANPLAAPPTSSLANLAFAQANRPVISPLIPTPNIVKVAQIPAPIVAMPSHAVISTPNASPNESSNSITFSIGQINAVRAAVAILSSVAVGPKAL